MISYDEAQELHLLVGGPLEVARQDGAYPDEVMVKAAELERAREIASVVVSDADPEGEVAKALRTVLGAAESWENELSEYIIPSATETCGDDAEGYQASYKALGEALELLRPLVPPANGLPADEGKHLPEPTAEFEEKRRELAAFLYELYHGKGTWLSEVLIAPVDDDRFSNYMADADDILRANPHLLTLDTVEQMGIDH